MRADDQSGVKGCPEIPDLTIGNLGRVEGGGQYLDYALRGDDFGESGLLGLYEKVSGEKWSVYDFDPVGPAIRFFVKG